jgi:hypothetical protein
VRCCTVLCAAAAATKIPAYAGMEKIYRKLHSDVCGSGCSVGDRVVCTMCFKCVYKVESTPEYGVFLVYALRAGPGPGAVSMLPVSSATRALIRATRDSIAVSR